MLPAPSKPTTRKDMNKRYWLGSWDISPLRQGKKEKESGREGEFLEMKVGGVHLRAVSLMLILVAYLNTCMQEKHSRKAQTVWRETKGHKFVEEELPSRSQV